MKKILLTLFFGWQISMILAQGAIGKKVQLTDKFFFGGGLGLQFGTITSIQLEPMVGYKPLENLYTGVKISYNYYNDHVYHFTTQIYGGSAMAFYVFKNYLGLYAEYEWLNLSTDFDHLNKYPDQSRFWIGTPLLGLGYSQEINSRSRLVLLVLFDLTESGNSPYDNPIIRMSYLF